MAFNNKEGDLHKDVMDADAITFNHKLQASKINKNDSYFIKQHFIVNKLRALVRLLHSTTYMKLPFDLPRMFGLIEKAVVAYPKAAMFELYERGYTSLFEQLISCIVSIRTLDETTIPVSLRLFSQARTAKQIMQLSIPELEKLLYGSTFPGQKAHTIMGVAQAAEELYNGKLPADYDKLTALKGVGPKCANLALGVAHKLDAISVDIHVHRVVNRWGFIAANTPEQTMEALMEAVPKESWININRMLMPFGKHICTGKLPHCSTCPVLAYCRQVGVTAYR